jgi:hypothetical protein
LVGDHSDVFASMPYVLVRSIDSNLDVAGMGWVQTRCRHDPDWAVQRDPLVISGRDLVDLVESGQVFFGFDELWLSVEVVPHARPDTVGLVAPLRLDTEPLPAGIRSLLDVVPFTLGIGDGYGLNFVSRSLHILECLGLLAVARLAPS